jgi:hypothetical protein
MNSRKIEGERNRRFNPVRRNQKCWSVLKSITFVHHLENRNFERFFGSDESGEWGVKSEEELFTSVSKFAPNWESLAAGSCRPLVRIAKPIFLAGRENQNEMK